MVIQHKTLAMQRRTAAIQEQQAEQAAAALRVRTRTELLNDAARRHGVILRQHHIARSNPHSIDNARRVAHAARTHSHFVNPGPFLIEGPSPDPYYINEEVTNVETGEKQVFHFDYRYHSAAWI